MFVSRSYNFDFLRYEIILLYFLFPYDVIKTMLSTKLIWLLALNNTN